MKKVIPYIAAFLISFMSVIPPLPVFMGVEEATRFVWIFLMCGVLCFAFIYTKSNIVLKILLPYLFINSFLSRAPYLSMTSFIGVVVCAYLYLLCTYIEDWSIIFKTIRCLLLVNIILIILQVTGHDSLLNFGRSVASCPGTAGNMMQLKSLFIILFALFIQDCDFCKRHKSELISLIGFLALVYLFHHDAFRKLVTYRWPVWMEGLRLSLQNPVIGYGLGTCKVIYPVLAKLPIACQLEGTWTNLHNFWFQILFETGFIGLSAIIAYGVSLWDKLKGMIPVGLTLIVYTLMFQFPDRNAATVPLLILFFAFIERKYHASK